MVGFNWSGKVQTLPRVTKLMKGWFLFMMSSMDEAEMVGVPIVLRRWSPIFDASQTKMRKESIWVRLLGLPVYLWTPDFFQLLGDHMGEFIDADYSFRTTYEMAMVCILVLLDLQEGLASKVKLSSQYGEFTQILDYEGVPFRCHRCHSLKHLVAQCDNPFVGKWKKMGLKEGAREEGFLPKKVRGLANYLGYSTATDGCHAMIGMIPRSVLISTTQDPGSQDIEIGTNVPMQPSAEATRVTSGMLTSYLFTHSSSSLKDLSHHMMSGMDKKCYVVGSFNGIISHNESCSIPIIPMGFSDPLVTLHSSEEHSSSSSRVLYDLQNIMFLSDTPSCFFASLGLG